MVEQWCMPTIKKGVCQISNKGSLEGEDFFFFFNGGRSGRNEFVDSIHMLLGFPSTLGYLGLLACNATRRRSQRCNSPEACMGTSGKMKITSQYDGGKAFA